MDFRGFLHQVWTIARQSLVQAYRMKLAVVLVVFMLIVVPSLPFLLKSDNTHEGQLRIVITYSVHLVSFLLGVLTLFLSAITLNTEIKNQHIYLLDPKPMARSTLLLGKWCGVMLINLILLTVMLGATYGFVEYLGRQRKGESPEGYAVVQWDVLSAREIARPPLPPLDDWVKAEVKSIVDNDLVPAGKSVAWVEKIVRERKEKAAWIVPTGGLMKWTVPGIPVPKTKSALVVRFRQYASGTLGDATLPGRFTVNAGGQPYTWLEDSFSLGTPHSFGVPSDELKPDGTLEIIYENKYAPKSRGDSPVISAEFPFQDGIQVLYPAATFGENVVRAGLVIFTRLAFIALVGIWASTFLSFPVAVLLSLVVFMIGYMANFIFTDLISQMYVFGSSMVPPWAPLNRLDDALRNVLRGFFMLFPNFGKFNVVPNLSEGMVIRWGTLRDCFLMLIVVRGGVLALTGWAIFKRRELAAAGTQT
jgi:ABC-type transport system involved in multi-copper enzyme maturation permease subunit